MKIEEKVNSVNEFLTSKLEDACGVDMYKMSIFGVCQKRLVQNDKNGNRSSFLPVPMNSLTPVTIDSYLDLLIFHRLIGGNNISEETFGGLQDGLNSHSLRMVLVTNKIDVFESVFASLQEGIFDLRFENYNADTERILRDELGVEINQGKNYPANLMAFTINYQLHE